MLQTHGFNLFSRFFILLVGFTVFISGCAQGGSGGNVNELLMTIEWPTAGTEQSEVKTLESAKILRGDYNKVRKEFTARLKFENEEQKKEALKNPMISAQIEQMTLNKLIFFTLVKHDAKKENISVSSDDVKKFKGEHLKKIGGMAAFKKILDDEKITEAEFDENLKNELLIKKFVESRSNFQAVGEAEAQQWYNGNAQFFNLQERIKASHILLKFIKANVQREKEKEARDNLWANTLRVFGQDVELSASDLDDQVEAERKRVEAKTKQLLLDLKENKIAFDEAARKQSEDYVSGAFGGDLDYLYQATTDSSFWAASMAVVKEQEAGKKELPFLIEEPVKSVFGYHIIRVEAYKKAGVQPFSEAKKDIIELLGQQRKQQLLLNWVNEKRKSVSIEFEDAYEKKDLFKEAFGKKNSQLSPAHIGVIGQPEGAVKPEEKPYQDPLAKAKG